MGRRNISTPVKSTTVPIKKEHYLLFEKLWEKRLRYLPSGMREADREAAKAEYKSLYLQLLYNARGLAITPIVIEKKLNELLPYPSLGVYQQRDRDKKEFDFLKFAFLDNSKFETLHYPPNYFERTQNTLQDLKSAVSFDEMQIGQHPLHLALLSSNPYVLKTLVEGGANLEAKNNMEFTPLGLALYLLKQMGKDANPKFIQALDYLLNETKASRENLTKEQKSTLKKYEAQKKGSDYTPLSMGQLLIDALEHFAYEYTMGTTINYDDFENFPLTETILYIIASLEKDDLTYKDGLGYTALHWAMFTRNPDFANALIRKGADFEAKENRGFTPLGLALHHLKQLVSIPQQGTGAIRWLLEYIKYTTGNPPHLSEEQRSTLKRFEEHDWKSQKERYEEKVLREGPLKSNKDKKSNEKRVEINEKRVEMNELLRTLYAKGTVLQRLDWENDQVPSVADTIASSIVFAQGFKQMGAMQELIPQVLKKMIANSPLAERILFLQARAVITEVGNKKPHRTLLILNGTIDHPAIEAMESYAHGFYIEPEITTIFVKDQTEFIRLCNQFLKQDGQLPYEFATLIHEIMHNLLYVYFQNEGHIFSPEMTKADGNLANQIRAALYADLRTAQSYFRKNANDTEAKTVFGEDFLTTLPSYRGSKLYTELPAKYVGERVFINNPKLLEAMFPKTTIIVIQTLNQMYLRWQKQFPDSRIRLHHEGLLQTFKMQEFNAEAQRITPNASGLFGRGSTISSSSDDEEKITPHSNQPC